MSRLVKTSVKELLQSQSAKEEIFVKGWVRSIRRGKGVAFITLNDGSCFASVQIVLSPELDNYEAVSRVGTGASLTVAGQLVESPAAGQAWEVQALQVDIVGVSDENYPLQKKRHSLEYLRSIAHLRPRSNTFGAVFRMRSMLSFAVHQFFQQQGFLYVQTPIITANDCEGAGEMFRVSTLDPVNPPQQNGQVDWSSDFFGQRTGLTVSGQLQGELFATAFSDIYTFGPTFRAENSNTSRHAAEFWMIEPEITFADLHDNCQLGEDFLRYMVVYALKTVRKTLNFLISGLKRG